MSNELTIAATAAIPAFIVIGKVFSSSSSFSLADNFIHFLGGALYYIRSALRPRASRKSSSTLHFRLILGDVERSMQEVEDLRLLSSKDNRAECRDNMSMMQDLSIIEQSCTHSIDFTRSISIAKGQLLFNVLRLRKEFESLFDQAAKSDFLGWVVKTTSPTNFKDLRSSLIEKKPPGSLNLRSIRNLMLALFEIIFGTNELMTVTTQYNSLKRDIRLLEAPEFEVSMDRKIKTATRMRASYHCFSPIN